MPFGDAAFSATLLMFVLHYPENLLSLLREARRVSAGPVPCSLRPLRFFSRAELQSQRIRRTERPAGDTPRREQAMYKTLYGEAIGVESSGAVVVPLFAGLSLAAYVASDITCDKGKLRAVGAAAGALKSLHRQYESENRRRVSHGDATAQNLIFDADTGSARWIDFDVAHRVGMDVGRRHADDLRALLYSSARYFPRALIADLVGVVFDGYCFDQNRYRDPGLPEKLIKAMPQWRRRANALFIAQAGFDRAHSARVDNALHELKKNAGYR